VERHLPPNLNPALFVRQVNKMAKKKMASSRGPREALLIHFGNILDPSVVWNMALQEVTVMLLIPRWTGQ